MNVKDAFFVLVRKQIEDRSIPSDFFNDVTEEQLEALYKFAKIHDMAHLLYDGFSDTNVFDGKEKIKKQYDDELALAVFRTEQIFFELQSVCNALTGAKIEHVPLKGAVLRGYYPQSWMRTSCDIDILIKKEDVKKAVEAICTTLNYSLDADYYHDVSLYAPSGVHVELHYELIESNESKKIYTMQKNVWDWLEPAKDGEYTRKMTDEHFYFYQLAHMAKHFAFGGCGIRSFVDMFILNQKVTYDQAKLNAMIKEGGLLLFDRAVKQICNHWFLNEPLPEELATAESYVLRGGIYGSKTNTIAVKNVQRGKKKMLLAHVFPKLKYLKDDFPILQKHKWLYPPCLVLKWCKIVFIKGGVVKKIKVTLDTKAVVTDEQQTQTKKMLTDVGLEEMMR